jgi:integrase
MPAVENKHFTCHCCRKMLHCCHLEFERIFQRGDMAKLYARLGAKRKFKWVAVEFDKHGAAAKKTAANATRFFLRYTENGKRKVEPAGRDLELAVIRLRNRELIEGGAPELAREFVRDAPTTPRVKIADAARVYVENLAKLSKSKATQVAYRNAVNGFAAQCAKLFLDDLTRQDILDHLGFLKTTIKKRCVGSLSNTLRNRLGYLGIWLRKYGVKLTKDAAATASDPGLIYRDDWPKKFKKIPDVYSTQTIKALLDAASEKERLVIEFFLYSGARDEELAYAEWSDLDARKNIFKIQAKPHLEWTLKDHEERIVPLRAGFIKRLLAWRAKNPGATLIFPNGSNLPDMHLIRLLQSAAQKAKVTERVTLHRFRRTIATEVARKEGIAAAQKLLGHSSLEVTSHYLAGGDLSSAENRDSMEGIYSNLAGA